MHLLPTGLGEPVRGEKPEGGGFRGPMMRDLRGQTLAALIGDGRVGESYCTCIDAGEPAEFSLMLLGEVGDSGQWRVECLNVSGVLGSGWPVLKTSESGLERLAEELLVRWYRGCFGLVGTRTGRL